jgi:hypothetical protein
VSRCPTVALGDQQFEQCVGASLVSQSGGPVADGGIEVVEELLE